MKRIRGGAPMRRIFSAKTRWDGRREVVDLKLACGHVVSRGAKGAPKRTAACWVCSRIENERIAEIESTLDPNRPLYTLDLRLDGLPTGQRQRGRNHYAIAKETEAWKRIVWFHARLKLPPYPLPLVRAAYTRHSATPSDPTNVAISMKAIEDGLVEVGVLHDDGPENYVGGQPDYRWRAAPPRRGFVTITITEERTWKNGGTEEEQLEEEGGDHDHRPADREVGFAE